MAEQQWGPVTYTVERDVAVLVIDHPPVNASTAVVRAGLLAGVTAAARDERARAVVLIGAGRYFVSGSDLREFAADTLPEPQLPEVVAAIERCPKPVVAALAGATLGGGFELALGCDGRIAQAAGVVGFPEVTLGMIPGAGGTQRTLRLVAPSRALELATSAERLAVERARDEGLVDEVVTSSLRTEAIRFARALEGKRVLRDLPVRTDEPGALEESARRAVAAGRARPAVVAAVGAVLTGTAVPPGRALAHERAEFNRLRTGREAAALRHLFFARAAVRKANRAEADRALTHVGVVGAGTMGAGIARACAEAGIQVTVVDQDPAAARRAVEALGGTYLRMVSAGRLEEQKAGRRLELLSAGTDLSDLKDVDLVIEAVFEDTEVKVRVLRELESVTQPGTTLATNTSYLDVDELAASLEAPSRLVGTHFFNPAHRAAVLEIVRGAHTSGAAMDMAFTAAQVMRKLPIVAGVCDGFIGNRIYSAYRRQCELMVEDGATPERIDSALEEFGFAMGPFAVADMSGLDIAWRMRQRRAPGRDSRERHPDVVDQLCERGRLGQKTGGGWYHYEPGSRAPVSDSRVARLIEESRQRKGITPRDFTADEIVRRALMAMANEAALLLDEGIADRAGDIDLMLTLAYGFPEHVGGVTFWARGQDPSVLEAEQRRLGEATGWGFRPGRLALLTEG
ncbi:3-hydroxyacyl-CoA dehydrogenase NAD-binding domain-containing protein [Streptomyces scabiei]|uniref:FAD-dependent oxidoreductase n=1 Tax=Streptomyces scabiei TaxID=1930 RepID=UPI001B3019A1|nr:MULTISPECIES: FAD-dependent oxidoreductase [Streptomyces]MDX3029295.1 3-hydroxyacyl-CoA dehydrogenase NAD-binding domain-containing protein [Streptomyces scabiei]MDX3209534.1 3-hydroxyacyl-CoA dehydrogenase NAD-binding domain-containing protein [Streptomyces scabiei]MDX3277652.1 3-hydroxyacyl-CoA dehydrogenase NAD-binding domain-containing protein [Streptomyces scabiei]